MPAVAGMNRHADTWHFPAMLTALHTISQSITVGAAGELPEWLHVIPAGSFTGVDGRGPYTNSDPASVVALFNSDGRKLPIDENHSIDLIGAKGNPSPSRGWIVALENRNDGIWGKVEWTDEGKALVGGRSYGFLSPAFLHAATKPYRVGKLLRVSLTNDPNLTHLKSLHNREDTAMLEELRKALGLPETADEAAVKAAVTALHSAQTEAQATLAKVATAIGAAGTVAGDALVTALQAKIATPAAAAGDQGAEIASLRGQVTALHNQLSGYVAVTAKDKATAVVEQGIKDGKIVPVLKDHYIARHQADPASVETEIQHLPSLHAGGLGGKRLPATGDGTDISAEEKQVAALMGVDETAYAATHKALHGKAVL